jgi:anti-sigma B factor antagonist
VTTDCPILLGIFDRFTWIRCEGKGSFLNSPLLKQIGIARIAAGDRCLVVDLAACTGMDSTFMGILAGLSTRLAAHEGGVLQIAEPGARNRRSLEDLGLDFMMEIDPPVNLWGTQLATIRSDLKPEQIRAAAVSLVQRTEHVLEAHQTLSQANEKNAQTFATVVTHLHQDLAKKTQPPTEPSGS